MPNLKSCRLQCLAPFEALNDIAKSFDVELTLYGGTASRAAMHLFYRPEEEIDIFELIPFSSDIDLEHTGPATKTYDILLAIQEQVPFASWFRWSIIDQERAKKAAAQRDISTQVPLRQVRFSNARDAVIPEEALHDLEKRQVSFARNPAYYDGGSASDRRDIEIYGLMMALNVGAELGYVAGDAPTYDGSAAAAWLSGTGFAELSTAAATPRLAARFWHLMAMQLARLGRGTGEVAVLLKLAEETGVLRTFNVDLEALGAPGRAFSVSKFIENNNFRIPELSPDVFSGKEARESFRTVMRDLSISPGMNPQTFPVDMESLIDPAFDLVAIIPELTIKPYAAGKIIDEDQFDVFYSGVEQEFVEIAWRQAEKLAHHPRGLTAQVIPWSNLAQSVTTSALPAVGGAFGEDRPWVRARLDDLVERGPRGDDGKASLIILQAKNG